MSTQPAWVRIQRKTFTRWCNNYLVQRGGNIAELEQDLTDGINLHMLLEILGGEEVFPKPNRRARIKLQKIENLNSSLNYIKSKGIALVNIGAEDIHDGKLKLLLGLIWTLILRFQIVGEDEDSANARKALLEWCNSVLNPQGIYVKNFTRDWTDGRAFCGLVNAIEPNRIPLNEVPAETAESNMERAFDDAEDLFGFPQVLDAIDVIENPDDLSIMTYVSYFRAYMLANNAYGPNCYAEGPGLTEATTHEEATFNIITMNDENERVERGGAKIGITFQDGSGADAPVTVKDNGDGTYTATYTAEQPGDYLLSITVKGKEIKSNPFHPHVKAGEPSPGNCEADGPGISEAVAGDDTPFRVITKDASGNVIPRGGANIVSLFKDPAGNISVTIVDNEDGTYAANYVPTTAGVTKLSVVVNTKNNGSGDIKGSEFSVNVKWAAPAGANSVASGPGLSEAVAGEENPFDVQVRDRFDNDIKEGGTEVAAKLVNDETGEEIPVVVVDNGDGTYHATYPGVEKAGSYTLTPTVTGDNVKDAPFTVTVKHGNPDGSKFTWEELSDNFAEDGTNTLAAGQTETFKVVSRDSFGNQISAGGLALAGKSDLGDVAIADNSDGSYTVSYTPTKAGTFPTSVLLDDAAIGGHANPFNVVVKSAGASAANFKWEDLTVNEEGNNVVVAGEPESFKVIAYDEFDNRVTDGGLNVKGTSDFDIETKDNGDGSYEIAYTPTGASAYKLAVKLDDELIGGHENPIDVIVIPAGPYGPNSEASGPGISKGVAGEENPFKIQAKDKFDNELTLGGADVAATLVHEDGDEVPVAIVDNGDGTYSGSYPDVAKAGKYTLSPTVGGEAIKDSPFEVIVSQSGASGDNFEWVGLELNGDGQNVVVAGETGTFTVIAKDKFNNRLPEGGLAVTGSISDEGGDVTVEDKNDGSYVLSYTPTKTDTYDLTVALDGSAIGGHVNPFPLKVIPADAYGPTSIASGGGLSEAIAGEENPFYIGSHDKFGNECVKGGATVVAELTSDVVDGPVAVEVEDEQDGTYAAKYPSITKAGTYTLTASVNGEPIKDSPFTVTVSPDDADAASFTWPGFELDADGNRVVVAGTTDTFTVVARDSHGNQQPEGGLAVKAKIDGDSTVDVATKDNGDGSYELSYTPTVAASNNKLSVSLADTLIGGATNPFPLVVIPAEAYGPTSVSSGDAIKNAEVGGANEFALETHDKFDNVLTLGGAAVTATLVHKEDESVTVDVAVTDNDDGTYKLAYPTITKAGVYALTPLVDGEATKDAPFEVEVGSGGFDPNNTDVNFPDPNQIGRKGPRVSVKDNQGNLRAGKDDKVEADLTPLSKIPGLKGRSNGDGTYDIDYPPNLLPGDYKMEIRVNGKDAPTGPFDTGLEHNEVSEEHAAALDEILGDDADLYKRLMLSATDAERDALVASLQKLKA
eukprot:TRINITY_DN41_c0_g1_i1.p1 TRINITY_DN41_c0_g1~~TRINITY_DN41_c0_g1_i1.p1  ORF type:complete len:1432 (-),score=481.49 TRINITY_DN41_c0_g1_i1:80-4375(-)